MPTNKGGLNRLENKTHRTFMCTSHRIAVIVIRFTALLYGFNVPVKGLLSLTVHRNSISFIMVMNNDKWYDDDNNNNNSQMWVNLNLRTYKKNYIPNPLGCRDVRWLGCAAPVVASVRRRKFGRRSKLYSLNVRNPVRMSCVERQRAPVNIRR